MTIHAHRLLDREAQVEEAHLVAQVIIRPQRLLVAEADGLPAVPVERRDGRRQRIRTRLVGGGAQLARRALELRVVEGLGLAQPPQARAGVAAKAVSTSGAEGHAGGAQRRGGPLHHLSSTHQFFLIESSSLAQCACRRCPKSVQSASFDPGPHGSRSRTISHLRAVAQDPRLASRLQ